MIGPCDDSIALIEERLEIMTKENALKKSERTSLRIKREQKVAREKAATSDITKFFKQVKTPVISSKSSNPGGVPKSAPITRPASRTSPSATPKLSVDILPKSDASKLTVAAVKTNIKSASTLTRSNKTATKSEANNLPNSKNNVKTVAVETLPKLDTIAFSPLKSNSRTDKKSKPVINGEARKSKLPTPVKKKKEPFGQVFKGNEQQISPTKKQKKIVAPNLVAVKLVA
jgi:hypothetical protein